MNGGRTLEGVSPARGETMGTVLPATDRPTPDDPMFPHVQITLIGTDSNPGAFIGRAVDALKRGDVGADWIEQFRTEAYAGNYHEALRTVMTWVWVDFEDPDDD